MYTIDFEFKLDLHRHHPFILPHKNSKLFFFKSGISEMFTFITCCDNHSSHKTRAYRSRSAASCEASKVTLHSETTALLTGRNEKSKNHIQVKNKRNSKW